MKIATALLLLISSFAFGQIIPPTKFDFATFGAQYVPEYRVFDSAVDDLSEIVEEVLSPFGTRSLKIIAQSNLVETPYEQSIAKAVIFQGDRPLITVTIQQYRNFKFTWINEDILHVMNSPGRCVSIDTLYDIAASELIYKAGYQHCGV